MNDLPNTSEKLYSVHWGRAQTVLHSIEVVPILVRVDAVQIPAELEALPSHSVQSAR